MRKSGICALLAAILAAPPLLHADFSYQESTQITGGSILSMIKMAGAFSSQARKVTDPIVSSVYLKGNRMARVSADSIEIDRPRQADDDPRRYGQAYVYGCDL